MASETKKILERNHKAAVLKYVDGEWSDTTEGDGCIQQLYLSSQTRKQFGLLERPNLTPGKFIMDWIILNLLIYCHTTNINRHS